MDDVILNKVETIERCIKRIEEKYQHEAKNFLKDYDIQDVIILNLLRACEASIDLGMHLVKIKHLGSPQVSADVFRLLEKNQYIGMTLCKSMQAMVGFRNIAVHNYTELDLVIVKNIIEKHLSDFMLFTQTIIKKTT